MQHAMYQLIVSYNRNEMPCYMNTSQFLCNLVFILFCPVKMALPIVRLDMTLLSH